MLAPVTVEVFDVVVIPVASLEPVEAVPPPTAVTSTSFSSSSVIAGSLPLASRLTKTPTWSPTPIPLSKDSLYPPSAT